MSLAGRSLLLFLKVAAGIVLLLHGRDLVGFAWELVKVRSVGELLGQLDRGYRLVLKEATRNLFPRQNKYEELKEALRGLDLKRNFASESSGARVVSKSKFIKHSSALIGKNKYNTGILFDCSLMSEASPAFLIVDLIEDFYIEEVLLVSRSVYTNQIRDFRLSSSLDLSPEQWTELGRFRNDRDRIFSLFSVKGSVLTRYLKLEILSAYEEYQQFYCSVSEMRVFGQTMTSFAKRRNELYLKDSRDTEKERRWAHYADLLADGAAHPSLEGPEQFLPSSSRRLHKVSLAYIETCPARHFRSLFLAKSPSPPRERFSDPYFELYDYLFRNIKDLKLNVDSLLRSVVKEKHVLSPNDPLRSYLSTFIKDRTQVLKRIKGLEDDVAALAARSRKLNSLMFLEIRANKLEGWVRRLIESKRRRNSDFDARLKDLAGRLDLSLREQGFCFSACTALFVLFFASLLVVYKLLVARIARGLVLLRGDRPPQPFWRPR